MLAEPVVSNIDVPPFANSAMDGYAIRSGDCAESGQTALAVVGSSFAGAPFAGTVSKGQCVRIMTGAVMPDETDSVLMQEHVERHDEQISFEGTAVKPGQNVRYPGEDTRRGAERLTPSRCSGGRWTSSGGPQK